MGGIRGLNGSCSGVLGTTGEISIFSGVFTGDCCMGECIGDCIGDLYGEWMGDLMGDLIGDRTGDFIGDPSGDFSFFSFLGSLTLQQIQNAITDRSLDNYSVS